MSANLGAEAELAHAYDPVCNLMRSKPILVKDDRRSPPQPWKLFFSTPFTAPLLIPNSSSDVRDHLANERTFLSWLRLGIYLAVVSIAILINFHLKHQPSALEKKISMPLGIIFWFLALTSLVSGFANYVRTVAKYARRDALVQTGIKTQVIFGVVSGAIVATCLLFLGIEAARRVER
ncbi:hypothetical protein GJ744_000651 [Endocarpon pusillum]|uniref:DUF202 domain-containing protein n=1 Tax=Endocarpon pusillum TaxID=364733 RepID=A0A8H7E3T2_9EURO|nr:hypothetical protein GJ744_000651 [Endocarpon pusillum]